MGLLFDNFENKFVVRGRKQGLEQGQEQADARWSAWITNNPEVKKLIDEGKVATPPNSDDNRQSEASVTSEVQLGKTNRPRTHRKRRDRRAISRRRSIPNGHTPRRIEAKVDRLAIFMTAGFFGLFAAMSGDFWLVSG